MGDVPRMAVSGCERMGDEQQMVLRRTDFHTQSPKSQCLDERESAKSFAYEAAVSRERMRRRFFGARERTRENSSLDEKVNKAEQRNSNVRKKLGAGRRWRTSRSVERDCIIP